MAGLVVEDGGGRTELAAAAVVLASGGYEWNAQLRERFLPGPADPPPQPALQPGGRPGHGHGRGADLANMNETWWYPASSLPGEEYDGRPLARFVGVERTAPHSVMVNRFGQRFVNEAGNYNDLGKAFFSFDVNEYAPRNLPCWVVFDRQYRRATRWRRADPASPTPTGSRHDTLEGLAGRTGIDPVGLAETVERWNRFVADGRDRDFGRGSSAYDRFHGDPRPPIPTWARSSKGRSTPCPSMWARWGPRAARGWTPMAGCSTWADRPIPGLYGAGNVIASPAGPAYYGGGTSIGMGLVWGHGSGTHAGAYVAGTTGEAAR